MIQHHCLETDVKALITIFTMPWIVVSLLEWLKWKRQYKYTTNLRQNNTILSQIQRIYEHNEWITSLVCCTAIYNFSKHGKHLIRSIVTSKLRVQIWIAKILTEHTGIVELMVRNPFMRHGCMKHVSAHLSMSIFSSFCAHREAAQNL
jgi:hypothetical protein